MLQAGDLGKRRPGCDKAEEAGELTRLEVNVWNEGGRYVSRGIVDATI